MKVHMHTKFCLICLLTFVFHHCNHCHEEHDHGPEELHRHHRGMTEPEPSKFSVQDAENEQRYYIERLFDRYGENGRLSFFGLEKLLTNLGLGEIKVVEISHEDLGHDHVSHLDMLAVQEGRHSHSHSHQHAHEPASPENQTARTLPARRSHKCDPMKEALGAPAKSEDKHTHDHGPRPRPHPHRLHQHLDHSGASHIHNGSAPRGQPGEPSRVPATETNKTQEQAELKPRRGRKDKGKKNNENSEVITPGLPPAHAQGEPYEHNRVHKPDRAHNPGHSHIHPDHNGHDPGHGHQDRASEDEGELRHARKREAPHVKKSAMYSAASHKDHGEDDHHHECLNGTQLLKHFGHGANTPISPTLFTYLCPALLYQIDSRLCIEHFDRLLVEDLSKEKHLIPEDKSNIGASAWICGIISITVISLLSLLGVILVPIINQGCFKFLLTFLVALAVGTMSGDALLHLLPHSQGGQDHGHHHAHGHGHGHPHTHEAEDFLEAYDAVLKGLVALGGIYVLFIIEHCIRMFKHYKQQRGKQKWFIKQSTEESTIGRKLSDHKLNNTPDADWLQLKPLAGTDDSVVSEDRLNETELTDLEGQQESPPKTYLCMEEEKSAEHTHSDGLHNHQGGSKAVPRKHVHQWHHKHSHHSHGPCHSGSDLKDTGIANIAWMVIMGDGIHNFSDGLAIGAAFSAGLTGGISTSIAVFCHELPHELGDFAVLLKAGMTVKQAIVYNLLSAMMAYVGMLIGTAVGQYANNITLWIFAVTAGMFLYVALVDMLPEMLHGDGDSEEHGFCPVGQFVLQNLGLLFGFAIMLIIALYEDKIVLDIQF
ncbi:Zinc transporter ZIP10 [Heterocephalus glaber]|nr:zinc transporter ZIP10 isoform X2 [Heterocephalus glaber]XP_004869007.1 zinc transporter ZIP10 isoform X2 [Heterocephalus glaber]XP_004869008.1 zinc transporter ZIP10 isoform X2 [Heterocephalus glaber]XP_004869009.1 zinc transporter ZIP10 isoform X2 [Heterocephalus glaber]XP_004869010.1 zinc transporter ZIP10 isoform X2 [Heterocephalus glaber]XP_021103387.1 zinc transporter ZIP10 isoform X2 [Heterocephalus glaber]EHA98967.1 Zinc transporter ZIP10 [Heterocephalus glaber]